MIPVLADAPASGQAPKYGRGRKRTIELGELGRQYSHNCGAEGDQNEEPAAANMLDPI